MSLQLSELESIVRDLEHIKQMLTHELATGSKPKEKERNLHILQEIVRIAELLGDAETKSTHAAVLSIQKSSRTSHLDCEEILRAIRRLLSRATELQTTLSAPPAKKRAWAFFALALFLSLGIAVAYWVFEKPEPFSFLIVFIGLVSACLGIMEAMHKFSVPRSVGYLLLLLVLGAVLALFSPFKPKLEWQRIGNALSSLTWTNEEAYAVYLEGSFDFSKATSIRIAFPTSQAGIKFLLRLVPEGANADKATGVRWEMEIIPKEGVLTLPLKAADFGLTPAEMGQLIQVSVHSGSNAWERSLAQDAGKRAEFREIEILTAAAP